MKTAILIFNTCILSFCVKETATFMPNFSVENSGDFKDAMTHAAITKDAAHRILFYLLFNQTKSQNVEALVSVSELFQRYFGDKNATTKMFVSAVNQIEEGSAAMDLDDAFKVLPDAHFDSEMILESHNRMIAERIKVFLQLRRGQIEEARISSGSFLHTLQDFYSHTNWVEIGDRSQNFNLGEAGHPPGDIAHPKATTCADCGSESCYNNIYDNIKDGRILTSGYITEQGNAAGQRVTKPVGKCSHGGAHDLSASHPSSGGINKDTPNARLSPHHYLHQTAANLAKASTVSFLQRLRQCPGDDVIKEFLGIYQGGVLCIVVDTSFSMAGVIVEIGNFVSRIAETRKNSRETKYILVPFNDPEYGPVYVTRNATTFAKKLYSLHAIGGGDADEKSMNGIRLALHSSPPGTPIFVFTDAQPKDTNVASDVHALTAHKNCPVYFILNDQFSDSVVPSKKKDGENGPLYSYDSVAIYSGGQVMRPANAKEHKATMNAIEYMIDPDLVTLLISYNHPGAGIFRFPIDMTVSMLYALGNCSPRVKDNVGIFDPHDNHVTSSAVVIVSTASTVLYRVTNVSMGWWKLSIECEGSYDCSCNIRVFAKSAFDVTSSFAMEIDGVHGGLKRVSSRPRKDLSTLVRLHMSGADEQTSPLSLPIGRIVVKGYDATGTATLFSFHLKELIQNEEYYFLTNFQNISQAFRLGIEAKNVDSNHIKRIIPQLIVPVESEITLSYSKPLPWHMSPGQGDRLTVRITNHGDSGIDLTLSATDSEGLVVSILPSSRFSVAAGETKMRFVSLVTGAATTGGFTSTVIVSAHSNRSTFEGYDIIQIHVAPTTFDYTSPTCTILNRSGNCSAAFRGLKSCTEDFWSLQVMASDQGLGLYSVHTMQNGGNASFNVQPFEVGLANSNVSAIYISDCCTPHADIVACDTFGNIGICSEVIINEFSTNTPKTTLAGLSTGMVIITAVASVIAALLMVALASCICCWWCIPAWRRRRRRKSNWTREANIDSVSPDISQSAGWIPRGYRSQAYPFAFYLYAEN